ncbi:hypothetical protein PCC9214_05344 [Planktothrix tepida]|uniref:Uncharacterized protein n=1 Tax=Planktothrix tepida PCC 9214 TaxID=671072 RepID=A0A1J1LKL7_9CYAN|nr:hypothetical protein [Planktothrix tepida]CAD5984831.1 hypothetical protein PCC9214_05306 [Planktothrix tepida]CAD5985112.1 hypothetical protein PCC9214_05344 [Planktothrix tepida]CUR32145.1 membrane hypothetical protein [Planktothrix tepida PCC 9214]
MTAAELKPEDISKIRGETLSTSLTDKERAPDENFFAGISQFFKDAVKAIANSDSWWAKLVKTATLVSNIAGGAFSGALIGSFAGFPGIVIGAAVGGGFAAAGTVFAGYVLQNGNPIAPIYNALNATKNLALAGSALAASFAIQQVTGVTIPQMVSGLLNFGDIIYDFNFDIPDSEIWKQITAIIDSLYGQAGQFLGSSFMRFVLTGIMSPPKVTIDINGLALAYSEYADDKRKELLQGITNFSWVGLNAAKRIGFLFSFLKGRSAVKLAVASMPGLKEINPDFVRLIEGWGDEENPNTKENEIKDWKISTWVESKVDSIADPRIKSFVEGMLDGMKDVIEDDVEEYFEFRYA